MICISSFRVDQMLGPAAEYRLAGKPLREGDAAVLATLAPKRDLGSARCNSMSRGKPDNTVILSKLYPR